MKASCNDDGYDNSCKSCNGIIYVLKSATIHHRFKCSGKKNKRLCNVISMITYTHFCTHKYIRYRFKFKYVPNATETIATEVPIMWILGNREIYSNYIVYNRHVLWPENNKYIRPHCLSFIAIISHMCISNRTCRPTVQCLGTCMYNHVIYRHMYLTFTTYSNLYNVSNIII